MENVCLISLGCAKNLTDSEVMLFKLKEAGYNITTREDDADIIIINTCCFIDSAKQESIDMILDVADYKKVAKLKTLIVAGCMGERFKQEVLDELPEVDGVCGTGDFENIVSVIEKTKEKRGIYISGCMNAPLDSEDRILTTPSYTAYLKIAEGCDNHCTYCVIPSIRGKYRSRSLESILKEAKALADKGVKELIIIAQDTSCYGKDLEGDVSLDKLVNLLSKIEGIKWVRLHYLYPEEITDSLISEIKNNEKVLNYFDIPLQHISNSVLKRMGRKTSKEAIIALINKIRSEIPDAVIRTSLIVGFPGETEDDFGELVDFVREYKIERAGVFPFSCEEGTPAAKLDNQLDEEVKLERHEHLTDILYELADEICEEKEGNTYECVVEGYDKTIKMYYGRTYMDSIDVDPKMFITAEVGSLNAGDFVKVTVDGYIDGNLMGYITEE